MSTSETGRQFTEGVASGEVRYDLEDFIRASGIPPHEAHEMFTKYGPYKSDLDPLLKARADQHMDLMK